MVRSHQVIENTRRGFLLTPMLVAIWFAPPCRSAVARVGQAEGGSPEVTQVKPAKVARGSHVALELKGKNFAPGARVSFSNPGIGVDKVSGSGSSLKVEIAVAADAQPGSSGLFVVNPDESEAESSLEVTSEVVSAPSSSTSTSSHAPAPAGSSTESSGSARTSKDQGTVTQQFEVYNLGEVATIIQNRNAVKGILRLTKHVLTYEENGQQVFSVKLRDIRDIAPNSMLGINTGTFHIILTSGKRYNFVAATLKPADGQAIVDALRHALP